MANDTSKLTINNETYDIKDANARCSKYQYTLNKNNWSNNTYALSVSASNIDCKCYNTIELSNYYDINQWKTYGISIESTEKNYDSITDTTTLATIYFKCETIPESNLTFAIASFPSKTSVNGDLVYPYNINDYTNADKTLVQDSPITTTATGSDLTLSTSAGNINALTVYGKSEVVNNEIVSAGGGYAVVDLGSLNYSYDTTRQWFLCTDLRFLIKPTPTIGDKGNILCPIYTTYSIFDMWSTSVNNAIGVNEGATLYVRNTAYTDPAAFKSAMSGVILAYEEATPTNNTIAIKTVNDGTGIDGTMAVFETGTPLRGIPDIDVQDVMVWNSSAGTVTKNCGEVNLGTLNWTYLPETTRFISSDIAQSVKRPNTDSDVVNFLCPRYSVTSLNYLKNSNENNIIACGDTGVISIRNTDYTDATAFKTAMSGVKLVYELKTPITTPLTSSENASVAGLQTFTPQTHAQNNAGATMMVEAYAGTANGKAINSIQSDLQEQINNIKNTIKPRVYAFYVDPNDSNPATRVHPYYNTKYGCDNLLYINAYMDYEKDEFNYGSWEDFIKEFFKPCMLAYDGHVDYYLDPDDYETKLDGGTSDIKDMTYNGNVMVQIKRLWVKRWTTNGKYYCIISDKKLDKSFKAFAHHDIKGNVLDYIYRAVYDGSYDGTRLRSISGIDYHNANTLTVDKIMSNTTRQQEINFAKANNDTNEKGEGWNILHKAEWDLINDLLLLIGMSTNTQATFGNGNISSYVSTSDTGIIATGTMDKKGLFYGKNDNVSGVKVFGIEMPWGNIWKSCLGWILSANQHLVKMTPGNEDGSTATDYNLDGTGYVVTGKSITANGYISAFDGADTGFLPTAASGSATTYMCDYVWQSTATYFACVGGASSDGARCGAFFSNLSNSAAIATWYFGAALSYKGLANKTNE